MEQIAEKVLHSLNEIKSSLHYHSGKEVKFPAINLEIIDFFFSKNLSPETFDQEKINHLDLANYLEFYLLKNFNASTKSHLSLLKSIIVMVNNKFRHGVIFWDHLSSEDNESTFEELLKSFLELDIESLNSSEKIEYIQFLINLYRHQEIPVIQKEFDKLISYGLWTNLSKQFLKSLFLKYPRFLKIYKSNVQAKKFEKLETSYVKCLIDLFWNTLRKINFDNLHPNEQSNNEIILTEKLLELFSDLMSQSSTRRHFRYVLIDQKFILQCKLTNLYYSPYGESFKKLVEIVQNYQDYALDDVEGISLTESMKTLLHYDALSEFQNILFSNFKEKFEASLVKSINNIDSRKSLTEILDYLDDEEIVFVCNRLNLSLPDESNWDEKIFKEDFSYIDLVIEVILDYLIKKKSSLDIVKNSALYPTETLLWDEKLLPENYDSRKTLLIPKMNLQFLSLEDYLIRCYHLFKLESSFEIKKDIEDVVSRIHPNFDELGSFRGFGGWARMGTQIKEFLIQEVQAPPIGEEYPAKVLAEIKYSVSTMKSEIKSEWEDLREHDVIFLISFRKLNKTENLDEDESKSKLRFCDQYGIQYVRAGEIHSQLDEDRNDLRTHDGNGRINAEGSVRILQVLLDPVQYKEDLKIISEKEHEVYGDFHLIIRRKAKENNFKAILSTIHELMKSDNLVPNWLEEVLLGYGDLETAAYSDFKSKLTSNFDFCDTFLDFDHYKKTFIENSNIDNVSSNDLLPSGLQQSGSSKSKDWELGISLRKKKSQLSREISRNKKNSIRFTETQIEAIFKSLTEGITLIEGPPGTGKSDVAVQICSLIYQNFPNERTLIVTHSNHGLNDIFEKITQLDIDERYLLRLGSGEKNLQSNKDFGKSGRVNFMLDKRLALLKEVKKLSDSLSVHIYHEFTCETAEIFYKYHISSRWTEYSKKYLTKTANATDIAENFPFSSYITKCSILKKKNGNNLESNELFENSNSDSNIQRAEFYWDLVNQIFDELSECRGFELIRSNKERGNLLVSKLSKVIAMTSTHAALKRKDFIENGFEFDNIIIEEAGQLLEIDTFIPLTLQKTGPNSTNKLKRIVLIGDRNQLPPIIKNNIFQRFSNMEQSLFSRLIRLRIPYITLNMQGRCRAELLELFNWKYPTLGSLPEINNGEVYNVANAGFKNIYQFINVPDLEGQGESTPMPHFYQNLAEAEFIIATYMFMILNGYPAEKITILTTYNGQKYLIRDIYRQKCSWNQVFKRPKITTVDKFQGQQNDYILLSLVRTKSIGHFRDPRRLVVALSRARLGLYVFGRYDLYRDYQDIMKSFLPFKNQSQKLEIIEDEKYPTSRSSDSNKKLKVKTIEDFKDMYKIVQGLLESKL